MSALTHATPWLRCPVCGAAMTLADRALACTQRHMFDVAKQGYVNLLGRAAPRNADTADMIAARARFLEAGHYAPITEAVAAAVDGAPRVLEVGAGTGHHLAASLRDEAVGLATDVSAAAARRAAKVHPRVASIVADTWAGLPIGDQSVDALLCIFAPRNADEFRRVLAPGGRVVFVVPNPPHLAELRERDGLLDVADHKVEQLLQEFTGSSTTRVAFSLDLDAQGATDLVGMGPNAHHAHREVAPIRVGVDVTVVTSTPGGRIRAGGSGGP